MKLLMITGDRALAQGKKGPFYYMLEEFSKHWDRIDIICPKVSNDKIQISNQAQNPNVKKFHGNVFVYSSPWGILQQPRFILKKGIEIYEKEKFDLFTIHSYPPFYNDIGGMKLYKRIKVPYFLEVMHITGYPKAGNFKEMFYKGLTKLFLKKFIKNAKAVRIINKKQTPQFLKRISVDKNKLKYIPAFYINFNVFRPQNLEKKYDLVFSGRLVKNKGINILLSAIEKLKLQNPNIKLAIVGDGPLKNKIKRFIKNRNLKNNIELIGWLPGAEDLVRVYNQSKIMVMPSFNEGGPRVNLEAMACGVPVITSRVGLMLDIINPSISSEQVNGLFIDWNSDDIAKKIKLLLEDKTLYKKIAENGFKTVQQFERKKAIKFYAESYKNLL